ncbi:MAG: NAD(P)/FAD-dependent oxidoreductase [Xanthobacteraceae bacterium]
MSEPLVIIGNGMAAARLVDELSARALGRYAVAVLGNEGRPAYNRILLSSLLADEIDRGEIELKPEHWWRDRGVTLLYDRAATAIDPSIRRVRLTSGATLPYAKLVLATGSQPVRLSVPGMNLRGVLTFRELKDVETLRKMAGRGKRCVVIGGGLLGLEAAHGLRRSGAEVTLVHLMDRLMERQLDARAAAMLMRDVERKGVTVLLRAETAAVKGQRMVEAVELTDGRVLPADIVVVAVGVRPNAGLAAGAGLRVNRGIVVDDRLQTTIAGIHAIGECAEHRGQCYGLVEPAYDQARVLACRLAGEDTLYCGSVLATNLKVSGINVFSAGEFLGSAGHEEITLCDPGLNSYKKLVIAYDRLAGAVLYGDTADGLWYLDLIRSGASIEKFRPDLAFGRALAERVAA